ncbi:MAG: helix-turn-helix transcriptional regulator [Bacteroidota bacterium]
MLKPEQVAAARTLIGWSQQKLSEETELSRDTIKRIEKGKTQPHSKTIEIIKRAFEREGIEFTPTGGVDRKTLKVQTIKPPNSYLTFLEQLRLENRHKGGEILFKNAINKLSSEDVINVQRRLRKDGFKMRWLIEEGDTFLYYPLREYRYIPAKSFTPVLHIIYDDIYATMLYEVGKADVLVIRNFRYTESQRISFNAEWEQYMPPTKTTAPVSYE